MRSRANDQEEILEMALVQNGDFTKAQGWTCGQKEGL